MAEKRKLRWFDHLIKRWRGAELPVETARQQIKKPSSAEAKNSSDMLTASPDVVSPKTSAIAEKLTKLKNALEFEPEVITRLEEVHSSQELLLYMHEVLLFKFLGIRETGLLSQASSQAIDTLKTKLNAMLANPEPSESEGKSLDAKKLFNENKNLKKQIQALHSRYVKSGVISERELELEQECDYLKKRVAQFKSYLQAYKKSREQLAAAQEKIRSLWAKNSLLTSKVEHQRGLLASITANQPEQQEFISKIKTLDDENEQLKAAIERQSSLLDKFYEQLQDDSPAKGLVKGLMDERVRLMNELNDNVSRLEVLEMERPPKSLQESYETLEDENIHLKSLVAAKGSVSEWMEAGNPGASDQKALTELLKKENEELKHLLRVKKEQVKVLSTSTSNRPMMRVIMKLKGENAQLKKESGYKDEIVRRLEQERDELKGQISDSAALARHARQMKTELEYFQKLVNSLRPLEVQYKSLKKEYSAVSSKYEALLVEHTLLINEYENLFGKSL